MSTTVSLPYGGRPLDARVPRHAPVIGPPTAPAARALEPLLEAALDRPIDAPRLDACVRPGDRVLVVVSDHTRPDPRAALVRAVLARLPAGVRASLAVATGTHGPTGVERLDLPADVRAAFGQLVDHDGHDEGALVDVGVTRRGTPVRIARCVIEADWVIATGAIRPHYFAGYGAGVKAIFPGLGGNASIRRNHQLKTAPGAVAGRAEGNPCRDDLEEVPGMLPCRTYLLNAVVDPDGAAHDAVAGDVIQAFRAGARACRPLYHVRAPASRCVLVSDRLPLTGSLYQASKLVAAVAPLVEPGGTVIVAAECPEGVGPVDTVNRAIYEIGVRPRLPDDHRIVLVSGLEPRQVAETYCRFAPSVESALAEADGIPTILPRAGSLIVERA